ncbi:hypothetical protein Hanom_Chr06g00565401 [Helianthus anomalus]
MGGGGGVCGILLDSSAILSSDTLRIGADYLLRKLRYYNIPTGLLYAVDLTEAKVVSTMLWCFSIDWIGYVLCVRRQ